MGLGRGLNNLVVILSLGVVGVPVVPPHCVRHGPRVSPAQRDAQFS